MSIEHNFYIDTPASRHELRDALVRAGIGLEVDADWKHTSGAISAATNVTILDDRDRAGRPNNGVVATRRVSFGDRKLYLSKPDAEEDFEVQATQGIVALLKAFPKADAYWEAYDAEHPMLLRRDGHLVLSQAMTRDNRHWDAEHQPYLALVDLPYTIEPLGPWNYIRVEKPRRQTQPAAR